MKRKKKTPRRKRQHFTTGSAMNIDRHQAPERRVTEIHGGNSKTGFYGQIPIMFKKEKP